MMSQKRQEAKDRLRSLNDYRVNLKAELEIALILKQLTEVQQRMEMLQQDQRHLGPGQRGDRGLHGRGRLAVDGH